MKKSVKILLAIFIPLVIIILTLLTIFLVINHQAKKEDEKFQEEFGPSEEETIVEKFSKVVYNSLPDKTSTNVIWNYDFEGYEDFKVEYYTDGSKYLSDDGIVTRDDENHVVIVRYKISYLDVVKEYNKNIMILKTSGEEALLNIVNLIRSELKKNLKNNYELPLTVSDYKNVNIIWKTNVTTQKTGEIEPTIKIENVNGKQIIKFEKANDIHNCFIEATITYHGQTINQNFIVKTKTEL